MVAKLNNYLEKHFICCLIICFLLGGLTYFIKKDLQQLKEIKDYNKKNTELIIKEL